MRGVVEFHEQLHVRRKVSYVCPLEESFIYGAFSGGSEVCHQGGFNF